MSRGLRPVEELLTRVWVAVVLVTVSLLGAVPAGGDWLKTRDGALIETEGSWEIRGAMVVFTLPGGTLSSMRVSEVDLEASREATAAALAPSPPPPPPIEEEAVVREPVLVVTNKDIPRALPSAVNEGDEGSEEVPSSPEEAVAAPPPRQESVDVVAWREVDGAGGDGVEIHGTVRNQGRDIVMNVRVRVVLLDEEDEEIASANAFLGAPSLAPTITTTFRALFPGVFRFETPRFEVRSQTVQVRESEEPGADEGP